MASSADLAEKAQFLKKVGSNLVLVDQNIKYFRSSAWKILAPLEIYQMKNSDFVQEKAKNREQGFLTGLENLPLFGAEPRSGEARKTDKNREYSSVLRGLNPVKPRRSRFATLRGMLSLSFYQI